jgi:transcriptional regulator with XRE-family HTH domain
MDYKSMGHRIRKCRAEKHLTQEKLAELAGISLSFLGHIERGTRKASLETIVNLANALGASTDYLLQESLEIPAEPYGAERVISKRQRLVLNELSRLIQDNLSAWESDD